MSDHDEGTTEPRKSSPGPGPMPVRGAKGPEPLLPMEDQDALDSAPAGGEDLDSTLNEGWHEGDSIGSRPKPIQPKPPEPRTKDSSSDDAGDSSCI